MTDILDAFVSASFIIGAVAFTLLLASIVSDISHMRRNQAAMRRRLGL